MPTNPQETGQTLATIIPFPYRQPECRTCGANGPWRPSAVHAPWCAITAAYLALPDINPSNAGFTPRFR